MPASAVYSAEDQWSAVLDRGGTVDFFGSRIDIPMQRRFGDLEGVRRYVEAVLAVPAVRLAYPDAGPVVVRERAGQGRAHYEAGSHTIAIPLQAMWAARESVVLHEVAHHLACSAAVDAPGARREWHGSSFRLAMCTVVKAVLGVEAELMLRAGYEASGLRTGVSP